MARFISADSVVPGSASGSMDGVALKPLTVDFHEPGFAATLASENAQPFRFQLNDDQRQQAGYAGGPLNPQALNRYSYVQNNPVKYEDPTGHYGATITPLGVTHHLTHDEAWEAFNAIGGIEAAIINGGITLVTSEAGLAQIRNFAAQYGIGGVFIGEAIAALAPVLGNVAAAVAILQVAAATFAAFDRA